MRAASPMALRSSKTAASAPTPCATAPSAGAASGLVPKTNFVLQSSGAIVSQSPRRSKRLRKKSKVPSIIAPAGADPSLVASLRAVGSAHDVPVQLEGVHMMFAEGPECEAIKVEGIPLWSGDVATLNNFLNMSTQLGVTQPWKMLAPPSNESWIT